MTQIANNRSLAGSSRKLSIAVEVAVNFVLPWLVYHFTKNRLGEAKTAVDTPNVMQASGYLVFKPLNSFSCHLPDDRYRLWLSWEFMHDYAIARDKM